MNIKSLLIGSAAALVAVSGAQAADAIVAAEPEPMEYVRVCDAFGTGFFYIPGTETCLKIGGFVRFQTSFGSDNDPVGVSSNQDYLRDGGASDWDSFTRINVNLDARNDTELGTLRSYINIEANAGGAGSRSGNDFYIDEAFIELAGFKVGKFYSWWDSGINGENDTLGNITAFNSIAYTYDGGTWRAGLSVDEIEYDIIDSFGPPIVLGDHYHDFGIAGTVGFSLGGVNLDVLGGYDNAAEEGAIRAILSAEAGPGTFQLAGIWASDPNAYWAASEWTVAASYAFKATERLTITPGVQYFDKLSFGGADFVNDTHQWRVGATIGYEVVSGLNLLATADWNKVDDGADNDDFVRGFLRLQRNF
ncbi:porin [Shinella sp. H4-D48]|uniref:porin n=1 Tax=Shinella sp. H4-D48 TaxID=2925841 RepID=UPI001F53383B|nr:porin [Shinella sp. H4-D48]UNK37119.1 porin [Shinella sp. H4-D48]